MNHIFKGLVTTFQVFIKILRPNIHTQPTFYFPTNSDAILGILGYLENFGVMSQT